MKFSGKAGLLVTGLAFAAPGFAHHSDAMFAREEVRELTGTVKEFQFTNPHTWVQLDVSDANGQVVEWSLEWGSPNQLGRQGIRPGTFPAGAEVTIRTNPMRDGTPGGAFIGARFPDGRTIGRWD
jgi:hypothetical protein